MRGLLVRFVTGSSWVDIEAILDYQVSDTTLRDRRDEWIKAGVFDQLRAHAMTAYDRICELDLDDVAIDGSIQKAPCGGEGTGKSPVDRGKLGWKWSLAVDANGIPLGWAIDGANRNDLPLLEPTLDAINEHGLLTDIGTLHLDRGYDYPIVRARLDDNYGLDQCEIQRRGTKPAPGQPHRLTSDSAGSSKQQTPGGPTTANSADPPTAPTTTATPPSASPPPPSSSADSSTTETDGAPNQPLSARPLSRCI